jgi:trehalose 6-phosphate phosphatase
LTPQELRDRIVNDAAGTALVLDFDGTLAPIVEDPAAARMSPELHQTLASLVRALASVAVVSGRPAAFLGEHVRVPGVRLLGVYGTEEWRDGAAVPDEEAQRWQPMLDTARDRIAAALEGHPGLLLEDKGLAVALHWRNAPNREAAGAYADRVLADIAVETGLAHEPGKFVLELRPPVALDKGSAVRSILKDPAVRTIVYAGDDKGDLAAFAAAQEAGGLAVAVDHGEETPQAVRDTADLVIQGTDAMATWLRELAAALAA